MPPAARTSNLGAEHGFAVNAFAAFGMQAIGVAATGVMTLVLVRLLGPHQYGLYALALSIGGLVLLPLDAGITTSTARLLSAAPRRVRAAEIVRAGLAVKVTIGVAASVVLAAVAPLIADAYGDSRLVWPIRLVAGVILAQSVFGFVVGCFTAVRMTAGGLFIVTVESLVEAVVVIALVVAGAGATGAVGGRLAAYGIAAVLGVLLLNRRFRLLRRVAAVRREVVRSILGYGFTLALVDAAWALFVQMDVILIAAILDSTAAGQFQAPVRLLGLVAYPGVALATALGPRVNVDDHTSLLRRFRSSLRMLLAFQVFAGIAALTVAPPLIQDFLGPKYGDAATLTRVLAPWVVLAGLTPIATNTLDYLGRARQRLPFAVAAVAVNALIDVILLPRIGVVAAAIGTDVGIAVFTVGALWICSRTLEYRLADFFGDLRGAGLPSAAAIAIMAPVAVVTSEIGFLIAALVVASAVSTLIVLGRDGVGRLTRRLAH
jgi:O-antigen/teichoic acid export membrane protein